MEIKYTLAYEICLSTLIFLLIIVLLDYIYYLIFICLSFLLSKRSLKPASSSSIVGIGPATVETLKKYRLFLSLPQFDILQTVHQS